jgi:hypothetical protein
VGRLPRTVSLTNTTILICTEEGKLRRFPLTGDRVLPNNIDYTAHVTKVRRRKDL